MVKYVLAGLAAIYCILTVFGDEDRRVAVARQSTDEVTGLTLAAFALPDTQSKSIVLTSTVTEADAIQIAMQAGKDLRANRTSSALRGLTGAATATVAPAATVAETAPATDIRYVSGSRVNLRSGPGTANAVVGQLVLGQSAEVLAETDNWFQIQTPDGATSGWIFGKFLTATKPG